MSLRYNIVKTTATGEQLIVDINQCNPITGAQDYTKEELDALVEESIAFADARMIDMNMRMLEAYQLNQFMTEQELLKLKQVLEVLCGRMSPQQLLNRWQSAQEETAELEAGRLAYAQQLESDAEEAFVNGVS